MEVPSQHNFAHISEKRSSQSKTTMAMERGRPSPQKWCSWQNVISDMFSLIYPLHDLFDLQHLMWIRPPWRTFNVL